MKRKLFKCVGLKKTCNWVYFLIYCNTVHHKNHSQGMLAIAWCMIKKGRKTIKMNININLNGVTLTSTRNLINSGETVFVLKIMQSLINVLYNTHVLQYKLSLNTAGSYNLSS